MLSLKCEQAYFELSILLSTVKLRFRTKIFPIHSQIQNWDFLSVGLRL